MSYSCVKSTGQFTEPLTVTLRREKGGHAAGTKPPVVITAKEHPISTPTSHTAGVNGVFKEEWASESQSEDPHHSSSSKDQAVKHGTSMKMCFKIIPVILSLGEAHRWPVQCSLRVGSS